MVGQRDGKAPFPVAGRKVPTYHYEFFLLPAFPFDKFTFQAVGPFHFVSVGIGQAEEIGARPFPYPLKPIGIRPANGKMHRSVEWECATPNPIKIGDVKFFQSRSLDMENKQVTLMMNFLR